MSQNEDGSPGIFDMIQELRVQLRKEIKESSDDLIKRIEELQEAT